MRSIKNSAIGVCMFLVLSHQALAAGQGSLFTTIKESANKVVVGMQQGLAQEALLREAKKIEIHGWEVLRRYAIQNPVCAEQFAAIFDEVAVFEAADKDTLHSRYHNGEGLPVTPRGECYIGRSVLVHGALAVRELSKPLDEQGRKYVEHFLEEVIEHADKVVERFPNINL